MKGKDKCRMLKQIRKKIADANDIPYVVEECPHQGECKGTCPKCEAELKKMEEELSLRRRLGKKVAVVGVAAGMMAATTACTPNDVIDVLENVVNPFSWFGGSGGDLDGDVVMGEAMPIDGVIDEPTYSHEDNTNEITPPVDDVMGLVPPYQRNPKKE